MTQAESSSIPTLTDVLVPGKPVPARSSAADAQPHDAAAIPVLTDMIAPGRERAASAASHDVGAGADADADSVVVEPVPTPHVPAVELPGDTAAAVRDTDAPAEPGAAQRVVADDTSAMTAPLPSSLAGGDSAAEVFGATAVVPAPALDIGRPAAEAAVRDPDAVVAAATGASVPAAHAPDDGPTPRAPAPVAPETAAVLTPEDAQHIAERLRNRLANYLTGEGRDAIEARCRDALHEHSAWLVGQITREVALTLETEVMEWVRDAIEGEIARRGAGRLG
ncbi:DUF2486 family protein [Burkholderia dolosa]|uniref:DUF2486 family protein n=1 Tax=Burkholderia dolosa TaxID=152500 RepID=UPI001B9F2AEF|nr:DUF2486 family protein [Burkholderia dolosa]MBR8458185.1 DUF2486 family protein [Burkholderia dolosa]MDN7423449.1 DUF2486 family protein [Burkholderia dolosa]